MGGGNSKDDIYFFTFHKCASVFISKICRKLSEAADFSYVSPNKGGKTLHNEKRAKEIQFLTDGDVFLQEGRTCFAPIRFFSPIAPIENQNVILHTRDPRDILVSMFYSYCFHHSGEIPPQTGYRKKIEEGGIDEFVTLISSDDFMQIKGDYGTGNTLGNHVGNMVTRFQNYAENIASRKETILVKYEDMVNDFSSWMEQVSLPFGLTIDDEAVKTIIEENRHTFSVSNEDKTKKKRQVTPGDHKNKLTNETIELLNERFKSSLDLFGYQ